MQSLVSSPAGQPVRPRRHARQAAIGLALAFGIAGSWLALHLYAMFGFTIDAHTALAVPVIALVQCWLSVGMFIVAHDAMHGSLAPRRPRLNAAIGAALLMIYAGFGWKRMRDAHFAHHRHPGSADDPDFDSDHPDRFGRWYLTFLHRYFGWRSGIYVASVVTLCWAVLGVPLANIVLLYGVPAILSSVQLFYFGTFRPHRHNAAHAGFADRHNARSEGFGPVLSLATCFHFGYHHEHHLSPETPWWALPRRRRETLDQGTGHGVAA